MRLADLAVACGFSGSMKMRVVWGNVWTTYCSMLSMDSSMRSRSVPYSNATSMASRRSCGPR